MSQNIDKVRGVRLKQAMAERGRGKAMAFAAELNISPAALTKWTQGFGMSIEHACHLASELSISLDWLLMGRNGPDWMRVDQLSELESELLEKLRDRPLRITRLFVSLISEIRDDC